MFSSLAKRQIAELTALSTVIGGTFKALLHFNFKRVGALFVAFFQLIGAGIFDTSVRPYGDTIDMSRFELVWQDEFDHGFDDTVWQGHFVYATMTLSFAIQRGGTASR